MSGKNYGIYAPADVPDEPTRELDQVDVYEEDDYVVSPQSAYRTLEPATGKPGFNAFGLAALIIGIFSMLMSFWPIANMLFLPMFFIGLTFGIVGLVSAVKQKLGKVMTCIGGGLCIVACALSFALTISAVNALAQSAVEQFAQMMSGISQIDSGGSTSYSLDDLLADQGSSFNGSSSSSNAGSGVDVSQYNITVQDIEPNGMTSDGQPAVTVVYHFINGSNEAVAFSDVIADFVSQDGLPLDVVILDEYSGDHSYDKVIESGQSVNVRRSYALTSLNPIEVSCSVFGAATEDPIFDEQFELSMTSSNGTASGTSTMDMHQEVMAI